MVYMWFAIVPRHDLATGNFQPNKFLCISTCNHCRPCCQLIFCEKYFGPSPHSFEGLTQDDLDGFKV